MPRKPAPEQFDTLKAIEERAFELFGRFGYEGVSIGDIAKAAKLSKGALYWHFQGKEALYLDCLKRLHAIFDSYVFHPMREEADPVKAILLVFTGLKRLMQDVRVQQGIAGYWLIPATVETERFLDAQRSFEAAALVTLAQTFKRAQDAGSLDLGDDLDDMARAMISLIEACVLPLRHLAPDEVSGNLAVLARSLFRAYAKSPAIAQLAASLE
jgi:TetR/AcrR family acrAB operon transcriptional repressor